MKYAFTRCNVISGNLNDKIKKDSTILVDGETITGIVPSSAKIPQGFKVVDCNNMYAMPGMINLHAHLFGTGKPSKVLGGGKSQEKLLKFIRTPLGHKVADMLVGSAAKTQLFSGVTTLRSSGDFVFSDIRTRDKVNAGKAAGPRMIVPGPALTPQGGHGDGTFAWTAHNPQEFVKYVDMLKEQNVDYIKICVTGGVMDAKKKGEPGELKMTFEETKAVCDEAHKFGYMVASHTESLEGERVAVSAGVDTIEHGADIDDDLAKLYLEKGAVWVNTFSPAMPLARMDNSVTLLSDFCQYNAEVLYGEMQRGVKVALEKGIPVGLGTDASCPFVTQYNTWRELYMFAKVAGVSNEFAIHTATSVNAKILHLDNVTGTLEQGKCADIIFTVGNPVENLKALSSVKSVVARGKYYADTKVKKIPFVDDNLDKLFATL